MLQIHINNVTHFGSGCPKGSVAYILSQDAHAFILISLNSMLILVLEFLSQKQKELPNHYRFKIPTRGFSYSVEYFDFRGYVQIPIGITATQKSTFHISK